MKTKKTIKTIAIGVFLALSIVIPSGSPFALGKTTGMHLDGDFITTQGADISTILSIFESKIRDQELKERMREKLFTLSETQTRLIATLSGRIANIGDTVGADIAILVVATLIILS